MTQLIRILSHTVFKKDFGPGPAHFIDPSITKTGVDGTPRYSLSSRHKELVGFRTPGPGAYAPESNAMCFQREKREPSYSMGARSKYRKSKFACNCKCVISHANSLSRYSRFAVQFYRRCKPFPQHLHSAHPAWSKSANSCLLCMLQSS